MKSLLNILTALLMTTTLYGQDLLFKSEHFEVYSNSVKQGKFEAKAHSAHHLVSNYQSETPEEKVSTIAFKFSINGLDNEMPFGQNHQLDLNPPGVQIESPLYVFGQKEPLIEDKELPKEFESAKEGTVVTFRLDMRNVLNDFNKNGFYVLHDGQKLNKEDFKGVYIAGSTPSLTWDFINLPGKQQYQLTDKDNNGIYEVTIPFRTSQQTAPNIAPVERKISTDLSAYPQFSSPHLLLNALYNMSLEEALLNIREDSAFMAGENWEGVWTRDISYSIQLALAFTHPEIARNSLRKKVQNKRIIQDTGTGGSWPVSSDRTTWALAAWEIYVVTGDKDWLKEAYEIISNTTNDDLETVYNSSAGLFYGESSFLDWREQSYPRWMAPKDIYQSFSLGTNAVHYQTYRILAKMALELGKPIDQYHRIAEGVKRGINNMLWIEYKGHYGQYFYGGKYMQPSPRAEALGEALCVLFDVAQPDRQKQVISHTPVMAFGTPSIYPQIPDILPYHNNSVWPFVEAYWTWAAAKAGNSTAVEWGLASMYRQAALFLTNKENMVAGTGDYNGTVINSDRQLWSVAGSLATVYRVFFGMNFEEDRLVFDPFVPQPYSGKMELSNFKYREANLQVKIHGFGSKIKEIRLDGRKVAKASIPSTMKGKHTLEIMLANEPLPASKINYVNNHFSPETPEATLKEGIISWKPVANASFYRVFQNGLLMAETQGESINIKNIAEYAEYQIAAVDAQGYASFLSSPVFDVDEQNIITIHAENIDKKLEETHAGYSGKGYLVLDKNFNKQLKFQVNIPEAGKYTIEARYANGNGPINTENKAAIRTLKVNGKAAGKIVMPQRGEQAWTDWGYSNWIKLELPKGESAFTLEFAEGDENMNLHINQAHLDSFRLIKLD
jgi:glycogen debranching enzyme